MLFRSWEDSKLKKAFRDGALSGAATVALAAASALAAYNGSKVGAAIAATGFLVAAWHTVENSREHWSPRKYTSTWEDDPYQSALPYGGEDEEKPKTEVAAPAPVINLNVDNSSKNTSSSGGGNTTVIKEKTTVVEKAAPAESKPVKKSETEDAPW